MICVQKQYTHVLFDWDGCLASTFDVWLSASQDILRRYGIDATPEEIFLAFGKNGIMLYFDIPDPAARQAELVADATARLQDVALYPGAKDALLDLFADTVLAIVSDSPRSIIDRGIIANGLGSYFSKIVARGEAGPIKPHPAGIELAMTSLGATKHQTLMIGDSDKDILAARSAGVDSVLFFPPGHERFYERGALMKLSPTHVISQFSDLKRIVKSPAS
jgi:phosphoglycolate phosphatase